MSFRFSEFVKRGKSGNPWADTDHNTVNNTVPSRPMTADSYDFRPNQPIPPPPPAVPSRRDTLTPACVYDNGTGRLDHTLVREQGLPSTVETTDHLAEFIRNRNRYQTYTSPPSATSHYSYTADSSATILRRSDSRRASFSSVLRRPSSHTNRRASNTFVAALRSRYAAQPIARVLPGTTRKHKYEGFWLGRGTMRNIDADLKNRKRWWKKAQEERPPSSKGAYVETSGWYD